MNAFPLIAGEGLPVAVQFVPALVIGFFFGLVLEGAGFGNSTVLAAQFYLHNMRVFKVMFTAIVTAGTGLALLSAAGLVDMARLETPETFLWPHVAGGLLLGAGFIVSGYCPGTSVVGAGSGHLDALVAFGGVVIGSLLFGEAYPLVKDFYLSTPHGVVTLHGLLGVPYPLLMAGVTLMAIGLFFGAEKVETIFSAKRKGDLVPARTRFPKGAVLGVGAAALLGVALQYALPRPAPAQETRAAVRINAVDLGRMLVEEPRSLLVVDLRRDACGGKETIPSAVCLPEAKKRLAAEPPTTKLVVYAHDSVHRVPPALLAFRRGSDHQSSAHPERLRS